VCTLRGHTPCSPAGCPVILTVSSCPATVVLQAGTGTPMLTVPLGGARIAGRPRRPHPCTPGMKHGEPWIGTLQPSR
jgi:hypothetical protein